MLLFASTTDKLQLITSAAATLDVVVSYLDLNATTGAWVGGNRQRTAITTATTTDVLAAPSSGNIRNCRGMVCRNKHASLSTNVTVNYRDNTTDNELYKCTLRPDATLIMNERGEFFVIESNQTNTQLTTAELGYGQRVLCSPVPNGTVLTAVTVSGTAYYIYVGRIVRDITALFVEFHCSTAGAGSQTAEVGLFSTTNPPNKSGQTLTKLVATGTVDSLTSTGMKRNTTSFAQAVSAGTHLWAAIRTAMATTQPTCPGLRGDFSQGHILTTTGGGALTGLSTASGTIPSIGTGWLAPDLRVTLD